MSLVMPGPALAASICNSIGDIQVGFAQTAALVVLAQARENIVKKHIGILAFFTTKNHVKIFKLLCFGGLQEL